MSSQSYIKYETDFGKIKGIKRKENIKMQL